MKALVEAAKLAAALSGFRGIIRHTAQQIPMLGCVKIEAGDGEMRLTGTDLDREMTLTCAADVSAPGVAVARYDRLQRYVGAVGKTDISIAGDDVTLHLQAARSSCSIPLLDPEMWPALTPPDLPDGMVVAAADFAAVAAFCEDAAGVEESRYYLMGIFLDREGAAVATDGHALARCAFPLKAGALPALEAPLPTAFFSTVAGVASGDLEIRVSETKAQCTWATGRLISKMIDGTFPDWRHVLPEQPHRAAVDLVAARDCFKRTLAAAGDTSMGIVIDRGMLATRARDAETGIEGGAIIDCKSGDPVSFGLNAKLAIAALDALSGRDAGTEVEMAWSDPGGPFRFSLTGDAESFRVVMPLRAPLLPELPK